MKKDVIVIKDHGLEFVKLVDVIAETERALDAEALLLAGSTRPVTFRVHKLILDRIHEVASRHKLSRSEALLRLVVAGLNIESDRSGRCVLESYDGSHEGEPETSAVLSRPGRARMEHASTGEV